VSRLLTVDEVAQRLRLHPITVRRHIRSGRLPATRIGRSVRVKEEDIEKTIEPPKKVVDMTPEELRAHIERPLTPEELERRRRAFDRMKELQVPIDISTATLKRVARRAEEVLYGDKTWEQLIDEES
jgi:excisionase family DNA binding protein